MMKRSRRPTITSPTSHIRSYSFRPFLSLILAGCLLCFLAGYINSICLISSFQMSISALTGTTSKMMIDLAKGNVPMTIHFFILIVFFVLGNFLSGALVGGSSFRIQRPYGIVLLIASAALAFGAVFEVFPSIFSDLSSISLCRKRYSNYMERPSHYKSVRILSHLLVVYRMACVRHFPVL